MFNIKGKKVLITGASGGIGSKLAEAFYGAGCELALHGTNQEKLEALKAQLEAQSVMDSSGAAISLFPANLSNKDEVKQLAKDVLESFGSLDILINNAGITRDSLLMRMKDEDIEEVLNINLLSTCLLSRDFSIAMLKKRAGRIINISSIVAVMGNPGQANYCASKAGIIGFSKSLAKELAAKNITVNCIAPGFIESAMTDKLNEKQKESILQNIPARRIGFPEEVAAAALYLASDEAAYITGQTLHINGGMLMV